MAVRAKTTVNRRKSAGSRVRGQAEDQVENREDSLGLAGEGSLFADSKDDVYYLVFRRDEVTKSMVFQFRLAKHEVTVERIQELRGGGEYSVREKVKDDLGRMVYGRQRTVYIEGPPKKLAEIPEVAPLGKDGSSTTAVAGPLASVKSGVDIGDIMSAGILNLFQAQQSVQAAVLEQVKSMHDRPQVNWGVLVTALSPILIKLLDRGPQDPVTNPVELAMQIATIVKEGTSPPAQLKDQLEVVNSFLDIKERVMPGTDDPVIALATTYLPKLIEVVQEEQRRRGQSPTSTAELEEQMRRRRIASSPSIEAGVEGETPMWQRLLKQRISVLVKWASQGKNPEVIADYEYEMLPDEFRGKVREWIGQPGVLEVIERWVPEAKQFPQWVEQFILRLRELFYGMESEVEEGGVGAEEKVDQAVVAEEEPQGD